MTAPTIEVGVALNVPNDGDFVLDDAVAGVIEDAPDYTLATGYSTVTAEAVRVSISRGKSSRLIDNFEAASVSVVFNNEDRHFDPAYLPSIYNGQLTPGKALQVKANDTPIVTGWVEDWDLEYDVSGRSVAVAKGTDAIGVLGRAEFDAWTSTGISAGTKLFDSCIQDEVDWPTTLIDFDAGIEILQSDSVSWGSNVLSYLQLVAKSDLGFLFASADGMLTFRERTYPSTLTSSVTFGAGGIPFQTVTADVGSEQLYARVGVDREGGTNQTATVSDLAAWQIKYGRVRSLSITGLLLDSDAQSLALAEYLLALYDTPQYRIAEVSVELAALEVSDQNSVLALDIGSLVTVAFTPNNVGDVITQSVVIQGIRHDIVPMSHVVTFSLLPVQTGYFRLDDADLGVLDDDVLAF